MSESRTISKTGAELQDVVELLDQLTGEFFLPYNVFDVVEGSPTVEIGGSANSSGYALDAGTQESVATVIRVPNFLPGVDFSKDISTNINWSAAATSGDVLFALTVIPVAIGEDVGGTAVGANSLDTVAGTADYLSEAPEIAIAASSVESSDLVFLKITRVAADGTDTMTGDALFHGVRISYTTNPNIV